MENNNKISLQEEIENKFPNITNRKLKNVI